jgi:DNA-directed RNA polymerase specialized sigma24 family protein
MVRDNPTLDHETWLTGLRERFVEIARKRVEDRVVEDVVQEALTIIFQKSGGGGAPVRTTPSLAWCFQVLRNVIGNHYQKERTRRRRFVPYEGAVSNGGVESVPGSLPTPLESLEREELDRLLHDAVAELSRRDEFCGRHLRALLADDPALAPARSEGLAESTYHVRLFRCRRKLGKILMEKGYLP